jgi:hypothetical protein
VDASSVPVPVAGWQHGGGFQDSSSQPNAVNECRHVGAEACRRPASWWREIASAVSPRLETSGRSGKGFSFPGWKTMPSRTSVAFPSWGWPPHVQQSGFGQALRISGSASPLPRGRRGTLARAVRTVNPSEWGRLLLWRGDCARRKLPVANSESRIGPHSERRQKSVSIQEPAARRMEN